MNQRTAILNQLKLAKNKGRTVKQLRETTGSERVSARIMELRDQGHVISKFWETGYNRFGHKSRFARYVLTGEYLGYGD